MGNDKKLTNKNYNKTMKMKKFLAYIMAALVLPLTASCGSDENEDGYKGENKIYLSAENTNIEEGSTNAVTVTVSLTKTLTQDVTLTFEVADDTDGVLKLEDNPVTIAAGSREGSFKVLSNTKDILTENTSFTFRLASSSNTDLKLDESQILRVTVTPSLKAPELTAAQKALLEGYKTKYNLDLTPWMGIVNCTGSIHIPGDGYTNDFAKERTENINANTVITLSDESTADQPVLKMTVNPLGMNDFLFWVLRKETIENNEIWLSEDAGPNYAAIMKLLDWSKDKPGTFSVSLDKLAINPQSKEITFVYPYAADDKELDEVPFIYNFSPWEKQKSLIAAGNAEAASLEYQDGTANPEHYLQNYNVSTDDEVGGYFVEPKASIDVAKKTMTFRFSFSSFSSSYSEVNVTYQLK